MNKKVRLKLVTGIIVLLIGIFGLVAYGLNRNEYDIPPFAIFRWYREVDGVKEYLVFNKDNSFEYYTEGNESIVDNSCKTYRYNKYTKEIDIKCKNSTLNYKVIRYKDNKLDIRFDTGDVRVFYLEENNNE